jgi:2-C-methyl-D-erythritol 4-phosphate cytidylyltransferase
MKISDIATIVLAGGKGERFGGVKQFSKIHGETILFRTIDTLLSFKISKLIIVVVPKNKLSLTANHYKNKKEVVVLAGGETRYESTKIGIDFLKNIKDKGVTYMYIHDGVRPIINRKLFMNLYSTILSENSDGVVPYLPISDSIISFKESFGNNKYLDRKKVVSIQTPHIYRFKVLFDCFQNKNGKGMENAQLMEYCKKKISYVVGMRENIKLTHKHDIGIFKKLLHP